MTLSNPFSSWYSRSIRHPTQVLLPGSGALSTLDLSEPVTPLDSGFLPEDSPGSGFHFSIITEVRTPLDFESGFFYAEPIPPATFWEENLKLRDLNAARLRIEDPFEGFQYDRIPEPWKPPRVRPLPVVSIETDRTLRSRLMGQKSRFPQRRGGDQQQNQNQQGKHNNQNQNEHGRHNNQNQNQRQNQQTGQGHNPFLSGNR
jgi:hypothetical protein